MAEIFVNGDGPSYPGVVADTTTDLLTQIKAALESAGWVTDSGLPSSPPLLMKSGRLVGGVRAWLRFTVPVAGTVRINGDFDGLGANLSTNRDWVLSTGSRVWIACDEGSGIIYVKPTTGNGSAYFFGYASPLIDAGDSYGWQIGVLAATLVAGNCQFAQAYNSTTKWQSISAAAGLVGNPLTATVPENSANSGNYEIGPYGHCAAAGVFRGLVKYAYTGFNGSPAGQSWEFGSQRIISCGVAGIRIL